ncbi:MAG: hypothetical protein ABSD88_08530 [Candidatus Korobacteraceae bacterium]|jgi:hypothetical protein
MSSLRQLLLTAGCVAFVTGVMAYYLGRNRKTPAQRERERRRKLSATGRITDGTVLEVRETEDGGQQQQFLIYSYDVGGVEYECAQEVTDLRPFINLTSCRRGLPASVKYEPHSPGNSIVASETWMGLRM